MLVIRDWRSQEGAYPISVVDKNGGVEMRDWMTKYHKGKSNAIWWWGWKLSLFIVWASGGSLVKNPPAMHEMQDRPLGREDPLEKDTATHSSILAWEIPWTEEPGGLRSMGSQESDMTEQLNHS